MELFKTQDSKLKDDLKPEILFSKCYVYFLHHYMHILNTYILKLESNYVTSLKLHMLDLKE